MSPSKNQPSASSPGLRGIVDALLQGSLVDLFQVYGVAIAPLPRDARNEPQRVPEVSAVISFNSARDGKCPSANGKLSLSVPTEIVEAMQGDVALRGRHADWVRELANQLMGRFKNRLLPYGARLQAGVPSSIGREALEGQLARASALRVYRARTRRGDVVATLDGTLEESELSYVGGTNEPAEGELLLF